MRPAHPTGSSSAYFETTSDSGNAADGADPDGDGQINIDEYAAGTNPKDAADRFRILSAMKNASTYAVTADGKASRTYVLERSQTLDAGPWTSVFTAGPLTANGPVELIDSAPPANKAFYRIRVTAP